MAWPPPVQPTDRTNAVPQQNTHPADHNNANAAINDLVSRVKNHETNTYVTKFTGAGSANTSAGGIGPIFLPHGGVWLVSMSMDVAVPQGSSAFGYLDIYPGNYSNANVNGFPLVVGRLFDYPGLGRTNLNCLYLLTWPPGGADLWCRSKTYVGSVPFNSCDILATSLQKI